MFCSADSKNKLPLEFDAWKLIEDDQAELIKISLKPNECIDIHKNPFPVIFYILCGTGSLTLNAKEVELQQGSAIFINCATERGIKNKSTEPLEFLVFKILA